MNHTPQPPPRPLPLWLDCDTGHDDAFAILLAARSPEVRLLGISTVYGNAPLANTTYNTRGILRAIGRDDIPVYPGAAKPLRREPAHAPDIHGASGLDGTDLLPEPTVPAKTTDAVQAMHDALIKEPTGSAWLVAVGSLTNVAMLFEQHPGLISHIAGLSIMGGAIGGGFSDAPMGTIVGSGDRFGNHTPFAEFNIYCDPEAAKSILAHPTLSLKTTLIPLDLTHQFLATQSVRTRLTFGAAIANQLERTPTGASVVRLLFCQIMSFFEKTYAEVFGFTTGPPMHDPLAVAATFRPELFRCIPAMGESSSASDEPEYFAVDVVTEGAHGASDYIRGSPSQCGRTVARKLPPGQRGVTIPRALDDQNLWTLIGDALSRAEHAVNDAP
ncbi:Uridine nucleosidase 1 [Teratosphaeriaceae sp. CCFEE 6253]|nr:Uridine nucleosidase 1 [Teratosphaeriaceae sp. CCFEE 6253]